MTYDLWDGAKDFLGAIGPVLISVPWFSDFYLRRRRRIASGLPAGNEPLKQLVRDIEARLRERIESPKLADFWWTTAGLACICSSFVIAFVRGLPDLL